MNSAPTISFIDSVEGVQDLINTLVDLPTNPPSLYVDLEGVKLSRQGTVSILQILATRPNRVFLVDIFTLGTSAFFISSEGHSLKSIFQSPSIPKVFFDIRNDSDALNHHFGIKMGGVHDLQVMEFAARNTSRKGRFLNGLAKCIEFDCVMVPLQKIHWKKAKEDGLKIFAPEHGGSYEAFNVRPLAPALIEYCAQDVMFLPLLWRTYNNRLGKSMREKVNTATLERILDSQSAGYQGHGKHKILPPW